MNYLKQNALKYEFRESLFLTIIILVSFGLGRYLSFNNPWIYVPIILLSLFLIVISQILLQESTKKLKSFTKGHDGEQFIKEKLKELPGDYRYLHSIKLKNSDLDFLIICKNGIFGIETKNQNGKITYDDKNKKLLQNYYPFSKNYLKQTKSNCWEIHDIIKNKLNIDQYIIPVLVFSGRGVSIETSQKVEDVNILNSQSLINFLTKKKDVILSQSTQDEIYNLFKNKKIK